MANKQAQQQRYQKARTEKLFSKENFLGSFPRPELLPISSLPEIAFLGRSNVGKSSLINRLFGRKSLAKISSKPGSTTTYNVYQAELLAEKGPAAKKGRKPQTIQFLDLPGFGYAKFSQTQREELWFSFLDFIDGRDSLSALCLLNDIRRDPREEELLLQERAFEAGRAFLLIVTKADVVSNNERKKRLDAIAKAYGLEAQDIIVTGQGLPLMPFVGRVRLVLEPMVEIPAREKWLYDNKTALKSVRKGLQEAADENLLSRESFAQYGDDEGE